jgi:hypothetical protein
MIELPSTFTHQPPKNYSYEVYEFKRNTLAIWCRNHNEYIYNGGAPSKTIWGFYNVKKQCYYSPVNSKKCGKEVDIEDTTPYSAMQILQPLAPTVLNFL